MNRVEQLTFAPSNNIENTLRFLKDNCPPEGYLISFSGGKDSLAVLEACKEARVPYRYYMKITTVDPPELTKYVKRVHPKCVRLPPPGGKSIYEMITERGLPTRNGRWCCDEFKEYPAEIEIGQHVLVGVRACESKSRADNWGISKSCEQIGGFKIAPILYWQDNDVWDFIRVRKAEYCELYDQGHSRIGCIGCPLDSGGKIDELLRWKWAYAKYRRAAVQIVRHRQSNGKACMPAWPGWDGVKCVVKDMERTGASKAEMRAYVLPYRTEALRWQDAQEPEYLMRRVMAWWLECPVDYWKLDELERYAASKNKGGQ